MIITAYGDEAATHGDNPRMTLGAIMGNAYDWRRFEKALTAIQSQYGFTIFHAKEFKNGKGEFKGWPREKRLALAHDLTDLIRTKTMEGITVTVPREQYAARYRERCPEGMHIDSQYGLAFRALMGQVVQVLVDRGGNNHTVHMVLESGHANVGDAVRIFNELKKRADRLGANLFGTITVAGKKDASARPLMVADFLAHTHYLFDSRSQAGSAPSYADMTVGIPNKKYDAGFTMLLLTDGWIDAVHQQFLDEKKYGAKKVIRI